MDPLTDKPDKPAASPASSADVKTERQPLELAEQVQEDAPVATVERPSDEELASFEEAGYVFDGLAFRPALREVPVV